MELWCGKCRLGLRIPTGCEIGGPQGARREWKCLQCGDITRTRPTHESDMPYDINDPVSLETT